jgi:trk system potassium uptake protein TrkH
VTGLLRAATPVQILVAGFAVIVLASAVLLSMPFSSADGSVQPFVDSLFMTSSAISTTGLVVADIGRDYTLFGQLVMLVVIQVGGIGYMCFVPLVLVGLLGMQLSISTRVLLRESMARPTWLDMVKFARVIVLSTGAVELVGAVLLAVHWSRTMPLGAALYAGLFHSVNAFCTAGMGIWSDSMMSIRTAVFPNVVLIALMLAGGIGFFVLYDLARYGKRTLRRVRPRALSTHSRLAVTMTAVIIVAGAVAFLLSQWGYPAHSNVDRVLTALFQAVSASTTTGFNTVDIGALSPAALFALTLLMFVGASPNSTGGGIKTTTLGVMLAGLWALLRGRADVTLFRRRVPHRTVDAAYSLVLAAALWCALVVMVMLLVEPATLVQVVFEVVSAFGNVGLSTGITPGLTTLSKVLLSATMFFGRVGPLAIGFSLIGRREVASHRYAETDVYVG